MIEYGFFDSNNHDRVYNSKNFSDYFEGLIHDGVYLYVGEQFKVSPGEGMSVIVGTGRAKILNRYVKNTTLLPVDISASDSIYPRIDAIVVGIDMNERIGTIKSIQGIPGEYPQNPEIPSDENVRYYVLAYVRIDANAANIPFENIRDMRGTSECPWVAGILEPIDLGGIADQYRAMINKFEEESREIIDKLQANKEIVDNLAVQIEEIQNLKQLVDLILTNISSGPIANMLMEVINARTSSITGEEFPSLSERLESDFSYLKKTMKTLDIISSYVVVDTEKGDDTDAEWYADDTLRITGINIAARAFEKRENFGKLIINIAGDVGMGAFGGCENVNEITVNCNKICDQAFWACTRLHYLTIGKSVSEIGSGIISNSAFYIPSGVRVMYDGTMEEWNAVVKAENWVGNGVDVENNVVICSDGTVEV